MLGDVKSAIGLSLDNWIADVRHVRDALPIHLAVAAGALRSALDNMSRDCSSREFVPLFRLPVKAMDHGSKRQRGIGAAARDHNIGASGQGFSKRKSPDVRIRAQDAIANRTQPLA